MMRTVTVFAGALLVWAKLVSSASVYDADGFHLEIRNEEPRPNHEADWEQLADEELDRAMNSKQKIGIAKNLILFIGDGMGVSTVTAARWMKAQRREINDDSHTVKLSWDHFPITGLSKTYNTDGLTPDSAGTANAFVCGVKSRVGVIGTNQKTIRRRCDTVKGNEVDSMVIRANRDGKWTGVVTTTRITHATPAAAYAHAADRNWECDSDVPAADREECKDIAYQLVHDDENNEIRVILGGGRSKFLPNTTFDPEYDNIKGERIDGRDLAKDWLEKHEGSRAQYIERLSEFEAIKPDETDYLLGLFQPSHMQYEADREDDEDKWGEPSLAEMVEKSIEILSRNDDGFVLYVEGGRIDHAHHATNAYRSLRDVLALEEAVKKAVDMTSEDDTLIVVTADHSHSFAINGYPSIVNDIFDVIESVPGEDYLVDDDKPHLVISYINGPGGRDHRPDYGQRVDLRNATIPPGPDDPARKSYRQDTGVPIYSETHAGEEVAVYASGPMSHLLTGTYEQSYIPHAMMYAACIGKHTDKCDARTPSAASTMTISSHLYVAVIMIVWFSKHAAA